MQMVLSLSRLTDSLSYAVTVSSMFLVTVFGEQLRKIVSSGKGPGQTRPVGCPLPVSVARQNCVVFSRLSSNAPTLTGTSAGQSV